MHFRRYTPPMLDLARAKIERKRLLLSNLLSIHGRTAIIMFLSLFSLQSICLSLSAFISIIYTYISLMYLIYHLPLVLDPSLSTSTQPHLLL